MFVHEPPRIAALFAVCVLLVALGSSCLEPECPDVCGAICAGEPEPEVPNGCPMPGCVCDEPYECQDDGDCPDGSICVFEMACPSCADGAQCPPCEESSQCVVSDEPKCPDVCGAICAGEPEPEVPDGCPIPGCACDEPPECPVILCEDLCAGVPHPEVPDGCQTPACACDPPECPDVCPAVCAGEPAPELPQGCPVPSCACEPEAS